MNLNYFEAAVKALKKAVRDRAAGAQASASKAAIYLFKW